jgi:hypothetical protein
LPIGFEQLPHFSIIIKKTLIFSFQTGEAALAQVQKLNDESRFVFSGGLGTKSSSSNIRTTLYTRQKLEQSMDKIQILDTTWSSFRVFFSFIS